MTADGERPRRSIRFAGRRWWLKQASEPVGPGPNRFDDSTAAADVRPDGSLLLAIRRPGDRWLCAEVAGDEPTGYGTYEWTIGSDVTGLDRQVVLGMFTWSDDPDGFHREIDIEVSAWGRDSGVGGQFVAQPSEGGGRVHTFAVPRVVPWRCSFDRSPDRVTFRASGRQRWAFEGVDVPTPGGAHPRINLWLHGGRRPDADRAVAVVLQHFRFTPRHR